jgi:hypothetical protein
MSTCRIARAFLLSSSIVMSGCIAGTSTEEAGVSDPIAVPYETMEGPVTSNGLDPFDFWAPENQQALRSLGAAGLLGSGGALVPTSLLDDESGTSVLRHAIRCALPGAQTVQSASGASFQGDLGLAPDWTSRALTTSERRWVTACLLQLLNGVGAHVSILLRGNHPALDPDPGLDLSSYTIDDTTAFGDVFALSGHSWVCVNPGVQLSCGIGASQYTLARLCGLSPTCGATLLGPCIFYCGYDADGAPTSCSVPFGSTYTQSIASKLEESVFLSLYPLCILP